MEETISIILKTSDFRGDHAADTSIAIEYEPNMTIMQLMSRVFKKGLESNVNTTIVPNKLSDHIEIRFQYRL